MWSARACLLPALLLLSACAHALPSARPSADQGAPLPTAVISAEHQPPRHGTLDTPILSSRVSAADPTPVATAAPAPTPGERRGVARLQIAAINLDRALVPVGLDDDLMPVVPRHDPGWYTESAAPGEGENIVLWGHALRFLDAPAIPAPFGRLNELRPGSEIVLYDTQGASFRYSVVQQIWATPDQVDYIMPTGRERLTLVSCIGDAVVENGAVVNMTNRLITIAEPQG